MDDKSKEPCERYFFGFGAWFYLIKALEIKGNQRRIFFFLLLMIASSVLDAIQNPIGGLFGKFFGILSELFALSGFSGFAISLGISLRSVLPSEEPECFVYHLIGVVWILGGIGAILGYTTAKILPFFLK